MTFPIWYTLLVVLPPSRYDATGTINLSSTQLSQQLFQATPHMTSNMSGTEKHNFEYLATNQAAAGEAMVMFPLSVACRMYTMPTALIPHDRARFEPELGEDSFICMYCLPTFLKFIAY
jgi:hypothetical protein